jgi:hypothetical protein
MRINQINEKWELVSQAKKIKNYRALRISSECQSELFIGINSEGYRCLLFFINNSIIDLKIREADKDKLSLSYLFNNDLILIKLKDFNFVDLFNDLILSIYSKIDLISDPIKASKEFVTTFYKWSQFFEDSYIYKLGEEQIQGLFGELFVLNEYIKNCNTSTINFTLASWKGLYDAANDFELDLKNVEVKTKKESKLFVKISSEYQLEKELDKDLELYVVSVKIDLIKGRSIHDMLLEIIKRVRLSFGDLSILYQALNQKGLTVENLKQYNNHRFIVTKTELFDAGNDDFPKLSVSNIVSEISNLKYKLRVTQLDDFLIKIKKY